MTLPVCKSSGKHSEDGCMQKEKEKHKMGTGSQPSLTTAITTGIIGCLNAHFQEAWYSGCLCCWLFGGEWRKVSSDTSEGILLSHLPLQHSEYIVEMYLYLLLLDFFPREMSSWNTMANNIKGQLGAPPCLRMFVLKHRQGNWGTWIMGTCQMDMEANLHSVG